MKTNKLTIQSLRKAGHKVRVTHLRLIAPEAKSVKPKLVHIKKGNFLNLPPIRSVILPKGGETIVEVDTKDGQNFKAVAITYKKDTYNKKSGVKICLDRIGYLMGVKQQSMND